MMVAKEPFSFSLSIAFLCVGPILSTWTIPLVKEALAQCVLYGLL